MSKNHKTRTFLVLGFLLVLYIQPAFADNTNPTSGQIVFDQQDGFHVDSELNISGQSDVRLTSIEIQLWNISMPDQWSLVASSSYLDVVVPYTDTETEATMWSWQHFFDVEDMDCTCYVEISHMDQTARRSFGVVVYVGDDYHRIVLREAPSIESNLAYSTKIYNSNRINLEFDLLMPPSQNEPSLTEENSILPIVRICPVSSGICLTNYSTIATSEMTFENNLQIVIDANINQISDGFYSLQVQIQDKFLTLSNNITDFIILDQTSPTVTLTAVDSAEESEFIVVDIDVDDSYSGSSFTMTWTITEPNGTQRSISESELLEDNRLGFETKNSGTYKVNALVRDLGGNLVVVSHNVTVENVPPTPQMRYDGFLVLNGSSVTIPDFDTWVFSANETSDSENDLNSLEYYWYVDGKSLLSGKSFLASSDIDSLNFNEIRLEVVDNDGVSVNLSFFVTEQMVESKSSYSETTLVSAITLFFLLFVVITVLLYRKAQSDTNSEFVKWTKRSEEQKN